MTIIYFHLESNSGALRGPHSGDSPPHIILSTPVAPLSSGDAIAFDSVILPLAVSTLVEVLASTILLLFERRAVEVVEHEVHVLHLLRLQVVLYGFVPVHLYLYSRLSLSWHSPRFVEQAYSRLLVQFIRLTQRVLLLLLLVFAHVKSLSAHIVTQLLWIQLFLVLFVVEFVHALLRAVFWPGVLVFHAEILLVPGVIEVTRCRSKFLPVPVAAGILTGVVPVPLVRHFLLVRIPLYWVVILFSPITTR